MSFPRQARSTLLIGSLSVAAERVIPYSSRRPDRAYVFPVGRLIRR
jgi:hypothetical protein